MEPRAHHVLIGLFTLIAAIAIVLFALWLSKSHQTSQNSFYRVIFYEPVRGLSRGSPVLYNGIRIGEVVDLNLDPTDLREAHVRLAINDNIPVHVDTKVQLVLTGVTGTSVVELSGGTPESPLLKTSDGRDPVMIATPSSISQLLEGGDSLITELSEVAIGLKRLMSSQNIEHLSNVMSNMDKFTSSLADNSQEAGQIINDVAALTGQMRTISDKIDNIIESGSEILSRHGSNVIDQAYSALAALEQAGKSIKDIVAESSEAVSSGALGLTEIGPTLRALQRTLDTIQESVRKFDEDPGGYIFGAERMQEFQQ